MKAFNVNSYGYRVQVQFDGSEVRAYKLRADGKLGMQLKLDGKIGAYAVQQAIEAAAICEGE